LRADRGSRTAAGALGEQRRVAQVGVDMFAIDYAARAVAKGQLHFPPGLRVAADRDPVLARAVQAHETVVPACTLIGDGVCRLLGAPDVAR
jgi:hypothetical protein